MHGRVFRHFLIICGLPWFIGVHALFAQVFRISESFDDPVKAATAFTLNPSDWVIADGELRTKNTSKRVVSFDLGKPDWLDYEIAFKVKRLAAQADSHFGILIEPAPGTQSRIYTRAGGVMYLNMENKKILFSGTIGLFSKPMALGNDAPWTAFRIIVKNGAATIIVDGITIGTAAGVRQGPIRFYASYDDVALDDLEVSVFKTGTPVAKKASVNLIRNSGFEQCTIDALPDFWGCHHWGVSDPQWVTNFDEWTRRYRVDTVNSYEGKRSMRIDFPSAVNEAPKLGAFTLKTTCLGTTPGKRYTLSAYMRSEPAGMKVSLGGQEYALTTEWKRYVTPFSNDGKSIYDDMVLLNPLSKGVFWVDAVQLEEGDVATPYAPMTSDEGMVTEEGNVEKKIAKVPQCKPLFVTDKDITLDGALDEDIWKHAERLELVKSDGEHPAEPAEACILYSKTGIYIGVLCQEENAAEHVCKEAKRDDWVWNDPSVELFLDPSLSRNYYYHLAFNRDGVKFDSYVGDISWNGSWKVATRTEKNRWTAEAFLPFGDFGLARSFGQRWGINICRNNYATKENLCWSPTYGSYHTPVRFGQIVLPENALSAYWLKCATTGIRRTADGSQLYASIVNDTPADGEYLVSATLKMLDGTEKTFEQRTLLKKGIPREIVFGNINAVVASLPLQLSIYSLDKARLFSSLSTKVAPPCVFEAQTQYDLYTLETNLVIHTRNSLDSISLKKASISVAISDGAGAQVLKRDVCGLLSEMDIGLDIAGLTAGNYAVSVALNDGERVVGRVEQRFRKRAPKLIEVKVDHLRRMVTVSGKPFIPVGLTWEGELTAEVFDYLARNGSTTIFVVFGDMPDDKALGILDQASQAGIRIIGWVNGRQKEKARAYIDRFKDHPAILAWMVFDEQFASGWGKDNYQTLVDTCAALQELDPWHPVFINENQYGISYLKSKDLAFPGSIISLDYYVWVPSGSFSATIDYARQMEEMGRPDGRPSWYFLLGSGYAFWASRDYTPAEQEFSTYASLINGVTGFSWFSSHPKSKSGWETIKRMWKELTELTPVVASTKTVRGVTATAPAVQMMVKEYAGALFLITLNTSPSAVTSAFDVSSEVQNGTAQVKFEGREISLANGIFSDSFAGYQRHVYQIATRRK